MVRWGKAPPRPGRIVIGEASFPLNVSGDGPPIVFLHGVPGDYRTWVPHHEILSAQFRCISYTQRGFGSEAWPEDGPPFGTATHATDLIEILSALRVGPVSLVAWSYSAHVALEALARRPDLFRSGLLYEPGSPTYVEDDEQLEEWRQDAAEMFEPVQERVETGRNDQAIRELIDASGGRGYFDGQARSRQKTHLASAHVLGRLMSGNACITPLCAEDIKLIDVPVMVAWGSRTRPVFRIPSETCAKLLGGDQAKIFGRSHLWPEEDPGGFSGLVATHVSNVIANELNKPIGLFA